MNKVVLGRVEGEWISRNILKTKMILEAAAQKDPAILERKTYRTLQTLTKQATEMESVLRQLKDEPFEFELSLSQKQKLIVREMIGNTLKILEDKIIPEYVRRDLKDMHKETLEKVSILKSMSRKLR